MKDETDTTHQKLELNLHRTMCFVGGFIGAYTLLNRLDNFGSAQTSNMIYIVMTILGGDILSFLIRLGGLGLYFTAIEITVLLQNKTNIRIKKYALIMETICLCIMGFIPNNVDPILGLYPVFFMMSTQWCVFHGALGYNSSTIFSTNNFKQFSLSLGNYLCEKKQEQYNKMILFANSLIFFHIGVAISFFACRLFHTQASWFVLLPLTFAFLLNVKMEQVEKTINAAILQE